MFHEDHQSLPIKAGNLLASGKAPNGADMAREKFEIFLQAIDGYGMAKAAPAAQQYPRMYHDGARAIFPHSLACTAGFSGALALMTQQSRQPKMA